MTRLEFIVSQKEPDPVFLVAVHVQARDDTWVV